MAKKIQKTGLEQFIDRKKAELQISLNTIVSGWTCTSLNDTSLVLKTGSGDFCASFLFDAGKLYIGAPSLLSDWLINSPQHLALRDYMLISCNPKFMSLVRSAFMEIEKRSEPKK